MGHGATEPEAALNNAPPAAHAWPILRRKAGDQVAPGVRGGQADLTVALLEVVIPFLGSRLVKGLLSGEPPEGTASVGRPSRKSAIPRCVTLGDVELQVEWEPCSPFRPDPLISLLLRPPFHS